MIKTPSRWQQERTRSLTCHAASLAWNATSHRSAARRRSADSSVGTSEARSARESLERAPEPAPLRSRTDDFERRVCAAKARACAGAEEEGERRASEAWWAEGRDVGER